MALSIRRVGRGGDVTVMESLRAELESSLLPESPSYLQSPSRGDLVWVDLESGDLGELRTLADELHLADAQLDFLNGNRSRLAIPAASQGSVAAVLHRVAPSEDHFAFAELRLLTTPNVIITVQTVSSDHPGLGPGEVLYGSQPHHAVTSADAVSGLISAVLREYPTAMDQFEDAIEEMEGTLFQEARLDAALSHQIYQLLQDAHRFEWALRPLESLAAEGGSGVTARSAESDSASTWNDLIRRTRRMRDRVELLRSHLENAVALHSTLLTIEQNEATRQLADASYAQGEQTKKISGWAAILFAPTLVASIYGMNFRHMPELHWAAGYPMAVGLMLGLSVTLWLVFKRKEWL